LHITIRKVLEFELKEEKKKKRKTSAQKVKKKLQARVRESKPQESLQKDSYQARKWSPSKSKRKI